MPSCVSTRRGPWRGWRPSARHREVGGLPPIRCFRLGSPHQQRHRATLGAPDMAGAIPLAVRAISWRSWACGAPEERRVRPRVRP
jgi:hypothetical protein